LLVVVDAVELPIADVPLPLVVLVCASPALDISANPIVRAINLKVMNYPPCRDQPIADMPK